MNWVESHPHHPRHPVRNVECPICRIKFRYISIVNDFEQMHSIWTEDGINEDPNRKNIKFADMSGGIVEFKTKKVK